MIPVFSEIRTFVKNSRFLLATFANLETKAEVGELADSTMFSEVLRLNYLCSLKNHDS
jgi:hypothetical protein